MMSCIVNMKLARVYSPPREEGWLRHQWKLRSHRSAADGVVSSAKSSGLKRFAEPTTPAAPFGTDSFFDGASTPPLRGGECSAEFNFFTPPRTAPTVISKVQHIRSRTRLLTEEPAVGARRWLDRIGD